MKLNKIAALLVGSALLSNLPVNAEPWVDTSNIFLRSDIQLLADKGIIQTPTTTFPLMWHDIARDIKSTKLALLNEREKNALYHIKHQLKLAKRSQKKVQFNAATDDKRFTSFGESFRNKNNLTVETSFLTDRFAFKLAPSYTQSAPDGDNTRFDGSYAAAFIGNWVFSAGMQDRWWGPGWDTSLSLSNNARPIPALALSRKSAEPVGIPFTDIDIPWTVTTFMGQMNDERVVKDTLLWGMRLNFKPTDTIEIGLTRLAQWAGEGRSKDFSTFVDVLKGLDNCGGVGPSVEECAAGAEPGNQMAGYDIRWSPTFFNHPVGIYLTAFAEDGDSKGGLSILGEERYQYGIDTHFTAFDHNWRLYFENTDTFTNCTDGEDPNDPQGKIGDCFYEHHIYQTGMRYKGRTLGNIYESDASSFVLGLVSQVHKDSSLEVKLRWLELNKDNHDKAPDNPLIGNTLTPIAEDMLMFSGKYQRSYKNWRYTIGTDISKSDFDNNKSSKNDVNAYINIEYNL